MKKFLELIFTFVAAFVLYHIYTGIMTNAVDEVNEIMHQNIEKRSTYNVVTSNPLMPVKSTTEIEAEVDRIIDSYNKNTFSETSRYGAIYLQMIQTSVGDLSKYKGSKCRINLQLTVTGKVDRVEPSNRGPLCAKVFYATWDIDKFPMPNDEETIESLREIIIVFDPN